LKSEQMTARPKSQWANDMNDCDRSTATISCALPGIAFAELLERCLGNMAFAQRILKNFETRMTADLAEIDAALLAQDGQRAARLAHQLRGSAANAAAGSIEALSGEIERLAKADDLPAARQKLAQLAEQWTRTREQRPA
jgi:HPt (histidine-containing phosphotransfer) domain-containing protein